MRARLISVALAVACMMLAACSSAGGQGGASQAPGPASGMAATTAAPAGGGTSAAGSPSDACSFLTPAEISAAVGTTVGTGTPLAPGMTTICDWSGPGDAVTATNVELAIIKTQDFANEEHPLQGITETQASGIGDAAHYMNTPGFAIGLSVEKGGQAFKVRVRIDNASDAQVQAIEKTLALDVLAGF
jgi:predicted small secreted protein